MPNSVVQRIKQRVNTVRPRGPVDAPAVLPAAQLGQFQNDRALTKTVTYVTSLGVAVVLARTGYDATGIAEVIGVSALFAHQIGN